MDEHIFKKKIKELEDCRGANNELVSYYVTGNLQDARSHIQSEIAETENIKDKGTRKNVKKALKHISGNLKWIEEIPPYGLVIFVGETNDGFISEFIEPPKPLEFSDYKCGSNFYIEPLQGLLDDDKEVGLIVVSRGEAAIGVYNGKTIVESKYIKSQVPSKHKAGGFSQQRFERDTERAKNEFFDILSEQANALFDDIDGVILGGHGKTKDDFKKHNELRYDLEIIDVYSTNYTDESGLNELVDKAQRTFDELEMAEEKSLVDEFMRGIKEGSNVEYGESKVRTAINVGAVDKLLISDDYTIDDIEEFKELVQGQGGEVKIISTDSDEGKIFNDTFGIGAFLRFRY